MEMESKRKFYTMNNHWKKGCALLIVSAVALAQAGCATTSTAEASRTQKGAGQEAGRKEGPTKEGRTSPLIFSTMCQRQLV